VSDLVTGEAVALDLPPAQMPSRMVAWLLDAIVIVFLFALAINGAGAIASRSDDAMAAAIILVTLILVFVIYPATLETLTRGRSIGKLALGLRIVRDDGGPIRFRHALVRAITALFEIWLFWGVIAVIVSLLNKRGKRLGDILAGTMAIRERVPVQGGVVVTMPPQLATWAASLQLTQLPDPLALAVRQYLSRMSSLSPQAQTDMGSRLAADVAHYIGQPVPRGVPDWAYLSAVLAERRRREIARMQVGWKPSNPPTLTWSSSSWSTPAPAAAPQPAEAPTPAPGSPATTPAPAVPSEPDQGAFARPV